MKKSLLDYTIISLKGIAMGAADVVPGVLSPLYRASMKS